MKVIVITGSTRGIGRGLAEEFLKRGHQVVINGTTEANVLKALKELQAVYQDRVDGYAGLTTNYEQMEGLYEFAIKKYKKVDIWINNAGIDGAGKLFVDIDIERVKKVFDTNLMGVANGSMVAATRMLKQGYGQIYNMEGLGSDGMIIPKSVVYGTSKYALTYFTKGLALELKDSPVQVGRLCPGMVVTDLIMQSLTNDQGNERDKDFHKVVNIIGDKVETVTPYLVERILKNKKNNAHINWLPKSKVAMRFATSGIVKRKLVE